MDWPGYWLAIQDNLNKNKEARVWREGEAEKEYGIGGRRAREAGKAGEAGEAGERERGREGGKRGGGGNKELLLSQWLRFKMKQGRQ